jgi:iron complex outermembrane receptor protein
MNHRFIPIAILVFVLISLWLVPIWAEEETENGEASKISVVVTANRIPTKESETTAEVTVITAGEVQESGVTSIVDLLETVPGIQFRSDSTTAKSQISMGGFGESSFGRVVVMVDGKRLNNPDMSSINWQSISLETIERIEVLHGGGSVLYGSGAIGGVINIITKKQSDPLSLSISSTLESYQSFKEAISAGIAKGNGSLSVSGDYYSSDGYRDSSEQQAAHGKITGSLYPTSKLVLDLGLGYSYNYYQMPGGLTKDQFEDDPTEAVNHADESTEHILSADLHGEYQATDKLLFDTLLGYEYKNFSPDMPSWGSYYYDNIYHSLSFQPQASFETTAAGHYPITMVSGIDTRYSYLDSITYDSAERNNATAETEVSLLSLGGYTNLEVKIGDSIGASGGFRFDGADIFTDDDNAWHIGPAWSIGLRWNPDENSKLYLRHERVFRYPFTDEQITYGTFLPDLEAEKGYLFETGGSIKISSVLEIKGRAYLNLMKHEIVYNTATSQNENLDETRRIGGETELTLKPKPWLTMSGSYAYVLPTFIHGDNEDKEIPLVSKHVAGASLLFALPHRFETELGTSYRGSSYQGGDNANTQEKVDGYVIVDASLRWKPTTRMGNLTIIFSVDNLLDENYASYVYYNSWSDTSSYYPGQGRSCTLSGRYSL